jgi:hypothetical protein
LLVKSIPFISTRSIFQELTYEIVPVVMKQCSPIPSIVYGRLIVTGLLHGLVISFIVTEHNAAKPPSTQVAEIAALPDAIPVTIPEEFTVATEVLLELQIILLFVALLGVTVAVIT